MAEGRNPGDHLYHEKLSKDATTIIEKIGALSQNSETEKYMVRLKDSDKSNFMALVLQLQSCFKRVSCKFYPIVRRFLTALKIEGLNWFNLVRLPDTPGFMNVESGIRHLIPIFASEPGRSAVGNESFEVGWCIDVTQGVIMSGPLDFLMFDPNPDPSADNTKVRLRTGGADVADAAETMADPA